MFRKVDISQILSDIITFKVAGDWFFYVWLLRKGKIAYFRSPLNYHRRHSRGVTQSEDAERHFNEIVRMQDFIADTFAVPADVMEKVKEYRIKIREYLLKK